jgi:hypothetical protein
MFDRGDFAIGNVRIALDLRRRRNGNGNRNHDALHRGGSGNIEFDRNLGDVRRVHIVRDAGDIGINGNVRLRFEQHCCVVEPNVNVTCHDERQRTRRNSDGILRDR